MNLLKENGVRKKRGYFRGNKQPLLTEFAGFELGDPVRLKIVAVPADHRAQIISLNCRKEFKVLLTSQECRDANGVWGPIWAKKWRR